jgi:MmyB-like transcription regulator ligand binding domain
VRAHRRGIKQLHHPVVGDLTLRYEALEIPDSGGLTLFGYTAEPRSASEDALKLLASWAASAPDSGNRGAAAHTAHERVDVR